MNASANKMKMLDPANSSDIFFSCTNMLIIFCRGCVNGFCTYLDFPLSLLHRRLSPVCLGERENQGRTGKRSDGGRLKNYSRDTFLLILYANESYLHPGNRDSLPDTACGSGKRRSLQKLSRRAEGNQHQRAERHFFSMLLPHEKH